MMSTAAAVQEVFMVEGVIVRGRDEAEDKGKREKSQAEDNRSKKRRYLPPPFSLEQMFEKENF